MCVVKWEGSFCTTLPLFGPVFGVLPKVLFPQFTASCDEVAGVVIKGAGLAS